MTSSPNIDKPTPESLEFLQNYAKNPESWISERIVQDLPTIGRESLDGSVRNDIKAKVMNGTIRV
tara:strand:+ start:208 stop:402 length:195 start_codon:yes stop_codon:yes gene_type:complete